MVYVLSITGKLLMPTNRHGKVRHMLNAGKAKVVQKTPFTIQLLFETTSYTQPITLGVDAGSKTVGLSASTKKQEVYAAEVNLRTDMVDLLSTRRQNRRTRRNRLRYRKPRFLNRVKSKKKGWLAPSVNHKESRKMGGDSPGNLVTLCETCHKAYHRGKIELHLKPSPSFRNAAFMGIMRWSCYNRLKEKHPQVHLTYGYLTKNNRIAAGWKNPTSTTHIVSPAT